MPRTGCVLHDMLLLLFACAFPEVLAPAPPSAEAGCSSTVYADHDGDGFGDPADGAVGCPGPNAVPDGTDCDDADVNTFPGAKEVYRDGLDQDCDGADATCASDAPVHVGDVILDDHPAGLLCPAYGAVEGDLWIRNRSTTDLSGLECLCSISGELRIMDGALQTLRGLEGVKFVGFLHLDHLPELTSIEGLSGLAAAREVELGALPAVSELLPLARLEGNLVSLRIGLEGVTDLHGLEGLDSVDSLSISSSPELRSLDGLEGLIRIGSLDLAGLTELRHVDALENVTELWSLDLADLPALADLDGLRNAAGVTSVEVERADGLTSLALPAVADGITFFRLVESARIEAAPVLSAVAEGANVGIWDNPRFADLSPLAGHTSFDALYVRRNSITSIAPLAAITSVSVLTIDEPGVTDVSPLAGLTTVEQLSLSDLGVRSLDGLALRRVGALGLARNALLTDVTALRGTSIGELGIVGCDALINLDGLDTIAADGRIAIQENASLLTLDGLGGGAWLESVVLDENPALIDIEGLRRLERIESLWVRDNPTLSEAAALALCADLVSDPVDCNIHDNGP